MTEIDYVAETLDMLKEISIEERVRQKIRYFEEKVGNCPDEIQVGGYIMLSIGNKKFSGIMISHNSQLIFNEIIIICKWKSTTMKFTI